MSLFDRLKKAPAKKDTAPAKGAKKAAAPKKEAPVALASSESVASTGATSTSKEFAFTLIKPHVSEKAAHLAGKGIYVFDIPTTVNKLEVRKAVEALYKVNVIAVRTIRGIGKPVSRGKVFGRRSNWKKALVELKRAKP